MSKNNEESLDLYDLVYDYLHETWDPIGVNSFGEPAWENSNYLEKEHGYFDGRFMHGAIPTNKIYRREKNKRPGEE